MTPEERTLLAVARLMQDLRIPYMVVGSVASSHHGRPRASHDVDIVIEPSGESLEILLRRLSDSGFYVDAKRAREALALRRQFNVIEMASASKVDLIVRKDRPFSREELRRRRDTDIGSGVVSLATAEDTILSKLEWARKSGESEKQLFDVAGILDVRAEIDRAYVERWAKELGVFDLWERVDQGRSGSSLP